jgi:hypothetical protein
MTAIEVKEKGEESNLATVLLGLLLWPLYHKKLMQKWLFTHFGDRRNQAIFNSNQASLLFLALTAKVL